jgi:hypothetical protein
MYRVISHLLEDSFPFPSVYFVVFSTDGLRLSIIREAPIVNRNRKS